MSQKRVAYTVWYVNARRDRASITGIVNAREGIRCAIKRRGVVAESTTGLVVADARQAVNKCRKCGSSHVLGLYVGEGQGMEYTCHSCRFVWKEGAKQVDTTSRLVQGVSGQDVSIPCNTERSLSADAEGGNTDAPAGD